MDQGFGKGPPVRVFAAEEDGNAAIELALVAGLAALMAFTMKELLAMPLLGIFNKATQALSQVLAG